MIESVERRFGIKTGATTKQACPMKPTVPPNGARNRGDVDTHQ
jgi:hypothetical protein